MSFAVAAETYQRYMGRFSEPLAVEVVARLRVQPGQRAVDVGCGPGAVTGQLVQRLGVGRVHAVDPSPTVVAAVREGWPGLDVRLGRAEQRPFSDASMDVAVAQLVVHFLADPMAGLTEMRRVTRPGGVVTASVWDFGGLRGPVDAFWRVVHDLDPDAPGDRDLPGAQEGSLRDLATAAGLRDVQQDELTVSSSYASFEEWWQTFILGVGPAGAYLAGLDASRRARLRERCAAALPAGPFEVPAVAWSVTARR
jgi:trans-aconitate methyltransferase